MNTTNLEKVCLHVCLAQLQLVSKSVLSVMYIMSDKMTHQKFSCHYYMNYNFFKNTRNVTPIILPANLIHNIGSY